MDIRQFSVSYIAEQDRILVRVNTSAHQEVKMWLTRRMMLQLWPTVNRVVIDHLAIPADAKTDGYVDLAAMDDKSRQMLAEMRQQDAVQKADFSTPYQGEVAARPLGETPLLVTEVNLTPKDGSQLLINFKEVLQEPPSKRGFQLAMHADMVFSVIQLLHHALQLSQWLTVSEAAAPAGTALDLGDDADFAPHAVRPTYLN